MFNYGTIEVSANGKWNKQKRICEDETNLHHHPSTIKVAAVAKAIKDTMLEI